jgi:hypothetical protein
VALAPPRPGAAAEHPADHRQALAWFEAEHEVLLAAVTLAAGSGFDTDAWQRTRPQELMSSSAAL